MITSALAWFHEGFRYFCQKCSISLTDPEQMSFCSVFTKTFSLLKYSVSTILLDIYKYFAFTLFFICEMIVQHLSRLWEHRHYITFQYSFLCVWQFSWLLWALHTDWQGSGFSKFLLPSSLPTKYRQPKFTLGKS